MQPLLRLALLALAVLLLAADPASAATKKPIYVSLGDSLAWSYTKTADGQPAQSNRGYTELVAAKARASRRYGRRLVLKKFGCPGENTTTYLQGGSRCPFAKSQHADSLAYIKRNRRRLGFITINLGNNNFTPCAAGGGIDLPCIQKGNEDLDRHLPRIYRDLRRAAGRRVPIVAFNVYDPYLALYLQGGHYRDIALLSVDLARQITQKIEAFAAKRKFRIADAFDAFRTSEVRQITNANGVPVPVAVAQICAYTFMCSAAPVGPDIHPNDAGYAALATAAGKPLKIN